MTHRPIKTSHPDLTSPAGSRWWLWTVKEFLTDTMAAADLPLWRMFPSAKMPYLPGMTLRMAERHRQQYPVNNGLPLF